MVEVSAASPVGSGHPALISGSGYRLVVMGHLNEFSMTAVLLLVFWYFPLRRRSLGGRIDTR